MNGAYPSTCHILRGGTRDSKQEQQNDHQKQQARQCSNESNRENFTPSTATRKRADSLQPRSLTPMESSDFEQMDQATALSAYLRSSYDSGRPRRLSSAEFHHTVSPIQSSPGDIRRLSGNFNAPTHVELERHKDNRKSSRGIGKLKSAVKGWVHA